MQENPNVRRAETVKTLRTTTGLSPAECYWLMVDPSAMRPRDSWMRLEDPKYVTSAPIHALFNMYAYMVTASVFDTYLKEIQFKER